MKRVTGTSVGQRADRRGKKGEVCDRQEEGRKHSRDGREPVLSWQIKEGSHVR